MTKDSQLVIKVGKIWASPEGSTEKFHLDVPVKFNPKEIDAVSNLEADIMLAKLKHEISVIVGNASITINLKCERCLKSYKHKIKIPSAEREFLDKKPKDEIDLSDIFLINIKDLTIDLYEMFRQEIILHFPLISVCSKSCKGLCPKCGIDKNKKKCKCKVEDLDKHQPFKNLKKIIKSSHG